MFRSLFFCLTLTFMTTLSFAKETVEPKNNAVRAMLPACNDKKLHQLLERKIAEYYQTHPAVSQLEQRTQKLIIKHMNYFEDVDIATFTPQDNIYVANKYMTAKINNGLEDDEMRICRTRLTVNLPDVYLLIYSFNYSYMIDIINLAGASSNREFFVIYD